MSRQIDLEGITLLLRDDLAQVEQRLREGMESVAPLVPEVGRHTLSGGGKRVRPLLLLLASRLCGYRGPRAIQVATAVEFLHTASLLHDDVVDGADTRRGRPSVSAHFGARVAILVGDFVLARASQMIVEDGDPDILWIFTETLRTMSEGEILQLSRSFDPELPEAVYLEVIGRKTSSLLATCSEAGAILGGVTRAERRALSDFGWQLGLAFQLVDDALDYIGSEDELGKPPLGDLAEGKVTMPLIATLKRCSVGERTEIDALLKACAQTGLEPSAALDPAELEPVRELVVRYRGPELTLERARACIGRAKSRSEPFTDSESKRALFDLAEFVVQRSR
ncbi:MAG: polyprenyl synthetase family protein [Myxococcales bacterium]|nr:polyprenyl synthetase family protein [Myxococcales bacterium]